MGFGIKTKIKAKYKELKWWYNYIVNPHEKSGINVKIPVMKKIKYNLLGFTDLQYVIFDLEHNDYRNYISTKERYKLEDINGRFAFFLGEKVMFERTFGGVVNVPHIHCWVKNGKFISLDNNDKEISIVNELQKVEKIIAKPTRSVGGGTGIHELAYIDGQFYIDGDLVSEIELIRRAREMEEYIFTKKISSAKYSFEIYPYSANTIRIVTVMDNESNTADLMFAFHRFGSRRSKFVDNINSGGIYALVDNETGRMTSARCVFEPQREYFEHPDTGSRIEGIVIPHWNELIEYMKKAHKCFPYYKFFAWDVTLDENNIPYILEINRGTDLEVQSIKPMRNEKLGEFMRKEGLLDY